MNDEELEALAKSWLVDSGEVPCKSGDWLERECVADGLCEMCTDTVLDLTATLRAVAREARREALTEIAQEMGVEFEDERVRYVAVQIPRDIWLELRALAEPAGEES